VSLLLGKELLRDQEDDKCDNDEVDQVREELPPAYHDRPDHEFRRLPLPARDEERDDRHDDIIDKGHDELVCGKAHDEGYRKPDDLVFTQEVHEFLK